MGDLVVDCGSGYSPSAGGEFFKMQGIAMGVGGWV